MEVHVDKHVDVNKHIDVTKTYLPITAVVAMAVVIIAGGIAWGTQRNELRVLALQVEELKQATALQITEVKADLKDVPTRKEYEGLTRNYDALTNSYERLDAKLDKVTEYFNIKK